MVKNKVDGFLAHFAAKWPEVVAERGFVPVPKCLITCAGELGLKPQEGMVLFNIIEKCWFVGDKSWQKVDTIAYSIGRKNSATRDITKNLAKRGFITKEQRYNTSNLYGLEPTADKLVEHMKHCKHFARNLEQHSQESSGLDSQDTSDYLEPSLPRNTYIQPNINSPDSLFGSHDLFSKSNKDNNPVIDVDKTGNITNTEPSHKHIWKEFTQEKGSDENDKTIIYYYRTCIYKNCRATFRKKGNWPWPGEYKTPILDEI